MAAAPDKSVKSEFLRALSARPGSYSFFAAVRRLEQLCPESPPIGSLVSGKEPLVHFAQVPHLYFAPSELFGFSPSLRGTGTLQVYFFGLFGPNGPLPLALTDYVHTRGRHFYDLAMQRFADMFHNRLIALFYRAGTRAEVAVSYDRPADPLGQKLAALAGTPECGADVALPHTASAGALAELRGRNRSRSLQKLLSRFFDFRVRIHQNIPCRLAIEEESRCCLGRNRATGSLGQNVLLGERRRCITEKIAMEIGPVDYATFCGFLPGGQGYRRLKFWLHLMIDKPLIWDLRFIVSSESQPSPKLDGSFALGYNSLFPISGEHTHTYSITCSI